MWCRWYTYTPLNHKKTKKHQRHENGTTTGVVSRSVSRAVLNGAGYYVWREREWHHHWSGEPVRFSRAFLTPPRGLETVVPFPKSDATSTKCQRYQKLNGTTFAGASVGTRKSGAVGKFLAMVESEKAIVKDIQNDKGKGAEHHHLKGKGKVDNHDDDDDLDSLDLANRIKKLKEDFGRLLKANKGKEAKKTKKAKKAREAKKAKEAKKSKDVELKANEAELKAKKANEAKE
nr:hypothetical protein [Tanacetum cinerariifolium]